MPAVRRFIVTWAQNATPVHKGFWDAMQHYPGKVVVIAGRYKNPTSRWSNKNEDDQWYTPELASHLTEQRSQVCPNLVCYGDVHVVPTAQRPLTGFEVFCGKNSGIFGHPRRALSTIPTASRMPRILATTGACTVANYTDSKAGAKGHAHHVIGALVVEVNAKGIYHLRHVSADNRGRFYDLDKRYTPTGVEDAPPAAALSLGDYHEGLEAPDVLAATRELVARVRPKNVVLHDLLNFSARSHHARGLRQRVDHQRLQVRDEVKDAVGAASAVAGWGKHQVHVVRSNHDEHLDRWLDECDPHKDPENAGYYFELWARLFVHKQETGQWPDALGFEAARLKSHRRVRYLRRNDPLMIGGVAYGFHGDKGANGARGSSAGYSKLGVKTTTGHTHTPAIIDGNYTAGVTARLEHGYNDLPSSWLNAHVLQYADGKRALIFIIGGRFCSE